MHNTVLATAGAGSLRHAVILATESRTPIPSLLGDRPKGLLEIDGESFVARSVRLLRECGVAHIIVAAGEGGDHYRLFAEAQGVDIVVNERYATTGSMATLATAIDRIQRDVVIVESDVVYESRALAALIAGPTADATVVAPSTGAGDERWVFARDGRVQAIGRARLESSGESGEFVGLTRLSSGAAAAMLRTFTTFVEATDSARMEYDTDALVVVAQNYPIVPLHIPDLCWSLLDDEVDLQRIVQYTWPAITGQPSLFT
jgi:choline kinase